MNVGLGFITAIGSAFAIYVLFKLIEAHNLNRELCRPSSQWVGNNHVQFKVYDQERDRVLAHNLRDEARMREDREIRMLERWWNVPFYGEEQS